MDLEKRVEILEKKVAALGGQVQKQLNEKILNGEISINQARLELGLLPISDELANEKLTKELFYNNKVLD